MLNQKPRVSSPGSLFPGMVDVWKCNVLLPDAQVRELSSLLSDEELVRAQQLRVAEKRTQYLVTRARLRQILGNLLNTEPDVLVFDCSVQGKPQLSDPWSGCGLLFNVSHSHDQALIAVAMGHQVGVDIERVENGRDHMALASRYFSEQEQAELLALPVRERGRAFYACWTRKEAFVKAVGDGITYGLDAFSVSVLPEEERPSLTLHKNSGNEETWSVFNLQVGGDYMAALVVAGDIGSVRFQNREQERPVV